MSVHFRPDYFKFPRQYFSKLNESISESYYYTSSDRTMLQAFFEINISKLPSRFPQASTASTATVNDVGPMGLSELA